MSKFLCEKYSNLEAYIPGVQLKDRKYIKLNTNEFPYPPSPKAIKRMNETTSTLNLYCDPYSNELTDTIAEYYKVDREKVFIGNGSDEVLGFAILAFFSEEIKASIPNISYGFYKVTLKSFGIDVREVPLKEDFTINTDDYVNSNSNIIIANPNAPTGLKITNEDIELILKSNKDRVVIIDEAYVDFGSETAIKLIDKYPNLIVVQTFSKSRALAGGRVGFAIASKEIIEDLNKIKCAFNPYNINTVSQVAAIESVKDIDYFEDTMKKVISTRERMKDEFRQLGFKVMDTNTNFIFVSHEQLNAEEYYLKLMDKGILTRYFKEPRLDNYLRISVGTDEEMDIVLEETKSILRGALSLAV